MYYKLDIVYVCILSMLMLKAHWDWTQNYFPWSCKISHFLFCIQKFTVLGCNDITIVGDGFCNDETNNAECNYDHGDCCLSNMNTDHCSECACSFNGIITTPGFPQNYAINLDITWIIQVPIGQYIEVDFISFDVGPDFSCRWVWFYSVKTVFTKAI